MLANGCRGRSRVACWSASAAWQSHDINGEQIAMWFDKKPWVRVGPRLLERFFICDRILKAGAEKPAPMEENMEGKVQIEITYCVP